MFEGSVIVVLHFIGFMDRLVSFDVTASSQSGMKTGMRYRLTIEFDSATVVLDKQGGKKTFFLDDFVHLVKVSETVVLFQVGFKPPYHKQFTFTNAAGCSDFIELLNGAIAFREKAMKMYSGPQGIRFQTACEAIKECLASGTQSQIKPLPEERVLSSYPLSCRLASAHTQAARGVLTLTNFQLMFTAYLHSSSATLGSLNFAIPVGTIAKVTLHDEKNPNYANSFTIECKDRRVVKLSLGTSMLTDHAVHY
jgi:hypothetical protein